MDPGSSPGMTNPFRPRPYSHPERDPSLSSQLAFFCHPRTFFCHPRTPFLSPPTRSGVHLPDFQVAAMRVQPVKSSEASAMILAESTSS